MSLRGVADHERGLIVRSIESQENQLALLICTRSVLRPALSVAAGRSNAIVCGKAKWAGSSFCMPRPALRAPSNLCPLTVTITRGRAFAVLISCMQTQARRPIPALRDIEFEMDASITRQEQGQGGRIASITFNGHA